MISITSRALRTVGALALALAAASPALAFDPQPDPPGVNPHADVPGLSSLRSSSFPAPHNPPGD
jgi:hypothetical protein